MATDKALVPNIDKSDLANFPNARIKDNSGAGDGTPVNRLVYGDIHEFFAKLMRLANIAYNGLPDNETNGYQLVDALIALATKNDFVYNVTSLNGVLQLPVNLATVKDNEFFVCRSGINFADETQIKGSGSVLFSVNATSPFKNGDWLQLIKSGTTITIIRMADANNLDTLVGDLSYLKAATSAEEFAGIATAKATTPYTNQLSLTRRINGIDSPTYLASQTRNGLLSKDDKTKLDNYADPVKNRGWFSGVEPGGESIGTSKPRSGDVLSATVVYNANGEATYRVTVANPVLSYFVRMYIQSEGSILADNNLCSPIFKIVSTTQFDVSIEETQSNVQSLKIHIEVVQI